MAKASRPETEATGYARLLLVRARAHAELGGDLDAQADLRELIRVEPSCSAAFHLLGLIAMRRKEAKSADVFFREAERLERAAAQARARTTMRFAKGTTPRFGMFGDYLVYQEIGKGGMATVHRAERVGTDGVRRQVALKRLLPSFAADPASVEAFHDEARLASLLRHRNIVEVNDYGRIDGTDYLAMELLTGQTLVSVLASSAERKVRIPVPYVLEILIQVCDALDYAHTLRVDGRPLGIIHRDVAPSNIVLSDAGAKLIDFGIAKAATQSSQTRVGVIKGKPGYLAPEYIRGTIDARADLFQLGIVAHELLTGRRLFSGATTRDAIRKVMELEISAPSRSNPRVSPVLDDIVAIALQRDPEQRWQSAAAMRTALISALKELGS